MNRLDSVCIYQKFQQNAEVCKIVSAQCLTPSIIKDGSLKKKRASR